MGRTVVLVLILVPEGSTTDSEKVRWSDEVFCVGDQNTTSLPSFVHSKRRLRLGMEVEEVLEVSSGVGLSKDPCRSVLFTIRK